MDLVIDSEISACQRKLSNEEFAQLEANILKDKKLLDPIIVWKGHATIIDGENRYNVCKKHGLPIHVEQMEFADKDAVFAWIDEHQTGRRNLDGMQLTIIRARMFARSGDAKSVADAFDVTPRQIYRDAVTAKAVEGMPEELQERLRKGELVASDRAVRKFGELNEIEKARVSEKLKKDKTKSLNEALPVTKPTLSEADRKVIAESLSDTVKSKIALKGVTVEPKDVKRLAKLDPDSKELVDDILTSTDVKDLGQAIDSLKPRTKKMPAVVDVSKLREKIGDTFGILRRLVDDLGEALHVAVEPVQDALKVAESNLP